MSRVGQESLFPFFSLLVRVISQRLVSTRKLPFGSLVDWFLGLLYKRFIYVIIICKNTSIFGYYWHLILWIFMYLYVILCCHYICLYGLLLAFWISFVDLSFCGATAIPNAKGDVRLQMKLVYNHLSSLFLFLLPLVDCCCTCIFPRYLNLFHILVYKVQHIYHINLNMHYTEC